MTMRRSLFGLPVALACAAFAVDAAAEVSPADQAAAQALFDEAKSLAQSGKFADACPKFAASQKIDPGIGTLLYLADCYEKAGQTATAWASWLEAARAAKAGGQADREKLAKDRAAALAPKLPKLTIVLAKGAEVASLEVKRDGTKVEAVVLGSAIPVDPGAHRIEASAPGRKTWSTSADVAAGASVKVEIPALAVEAVAVAAPPAKQAAPAAPAKAASPVKTTVAYTALGVGAVGVGLGVVFALSSRSKHQDLDAACPDGACPESKRAEIEGLASDATSAGRNAFISFAVGGVALAAGTTLLLVGGKGGGEAPAASEPSLHAYVGPGAAGFAGRF